MHVPKRCIVLWIAVMQTYILKHGLSDPVDQATLRNKKDKEIT